MTTGKECLFRAECETAPLCRGLAPEAHTSVTAQLSAAIIRFLTDTGRDPQCFSPATEVCVCVHVHACVLGTDNKEKRREIKY